MPMDAPVAVKEAVLPFKRFRTVEGHVVDSVLGPEMRSTGEVMGIDSNFPKAFAKSQEAAYGGLPSSGAVFVSVADRDKRAIVLPVLRLSQLGFAILATEGTAEVLARNGIEAEVVRKYFMGQEVVDGPAFDRRADQRGPSGCRDQHPERSQCARRRLRDPHGHRRCRQTTLHDDRATCRGRGIVRSDSRRIRGQVPAGIRDRPSGSASEGIHECLS